MLATETRSYPKNAISFCTCGQLNDDMNDVFYPEINNFPVIKSIQRPCVSKSYEVSGRTVSESFFETSYCEEDIEFVNDFAMSHKNGIILVISDTMTQQEINYFTINMKKKLKYIIYYNGDASQFNLDYSPGLTFIRTFSLKAAINEAYKKAKTGQAIVLPQVDQNFDLFEYIDYLN